MTPFERAKAEEAMRDQRRLLQTDDQSFRRGWNAALRAAEDIVKEKHDPCEPWLDPGDLMRALEIDIHT